VERISLFCLHAFGIVVFYYLGILLSMVGWDGLGIEVMVMRLPKGSV
jgi:hypothetical protein